eukprot:TRINITY_DN499_c1_g1_i1.p1 TRINITY_DN499_c1_g1~~TRINITY_DN499_c1_g1_i1.p1  ORF type:complete len:155 (+),score=21.44 TRINITY_DN499_c1_g1_i1:122-586(+)
MSKERSRLISLVCQGSKTARQDLTPSFHCSSQKKIIAMECSPQSSSQTRTQEKSKTLERSALTAPDNDLLPTPEARCFSTLVSPDMFVNRWVHFNFGEFEELGEWDNYRISRLMITSNVVYHAAANGVVVTVPVRQSIDFELGSIEVTCEEHQK